MTRRPVGSAFAATLLASIQPTVKDDLEKLKLDPEAKYIMFVDPSVVNPHVLLNANFPGGWPEILTICTNPNAAVDPIRLYKL